MGRLISKELSDDISVFPGQHDRVLWRLQLECTHCEITYQIGIWSIPAQCLPMLLKFIVGRARCHALWCAVLRIKKLGVCKRQKEWQVQPEVGTEVGNDNNCVRMCHNQVGIHKELDTGERKWSNQLPTVLFANIQSLREPYLIICCTQAALLT